MFDDPHIYICQQHPEQYVLMQYTGLDDKTGKPVFGNYDVLSRTLDDGSEHRDTIELGWSRAGQCGFVWSKSRAIVTRQDSIGKRTRSSATPWSPRNSLRGRWP